MGVEGAFFTSFTPYSIVNKGLTDTLHGRYAEWRTNQKRCRQIVRSVCNLKPGVMIQMQAT